MTLPTVFLLLDEHPKQLMFVCPLCDHQNFTEPTPRLAWFKCQGCGISIDARDADLEVLTDHPAAAQTPAPPFP
jgi:hypothetical protein